MLNTLLSGKFNADMLLAQAFAAVVVIFLTLPFHEFAHAFVADKLGDRTPRYQGRLTVNPFAHIDYMGALATVLFGFGWANPVQVNARNFKNPKLGMALTAAAGPIMNLLLAFFALFLKYPAVIYLPNGLKPIVYEFLWRYASINIVLAVFNLIPIPPLDGSRVLSVFLPTRWYFSIMRYERFISLAIILMIFSGVLDYPIYVVSNYIYGILDYLPRLIFGFGY